MQGYDENADLLIPRYEALNFSLVHKPVRHLFPKQAGAVLDIGAGTGRDASVFANMGHRVTAIEPTTPLREAGMRLHPSPNIRWIDDRLPDLISLDGYHRHFGLVMLTGVWMHLDCHEQKTAMSNICTLLEGDGKLIMSLRHGPIPPGRRMFHVPADTVIDLAAENGLNVLLRQDEQSLQEENRRAGVTWTHLAFCKS